MFLCVASGGGVSLLSLQRRLNKEAWYLSAFEYCDSWRNHVAAFRAVSAYLPSRVQIPPRGS
jgi:hypothetical protein